MKIILEYNESTGEINDYNGTFLGSFIGAKGFTYTEEENTTLKTITTLKSNGFEVEDIVKLKDAGLI